MSSQRSWLLGQPARSGHEWQRRGYHVQLIVLALPGVESAIARVAVRVKQGGHDIPIPTIRRRYEKGWHNFPSRCKPIASEWMFVDNSGDAPVFLDHSQP